MPVNVALLTPSTPATLQLLPCLLTLALPPTKPRISPLPSAVAAAAAAVAGGNSAGTSARGDGGSRAVEQLPSQRATETTPLLGAALEDRV